MSEPRTRAVQGGTEPDPETGALLPPLHQSTTYAQEAPGHHAGYTYSRQANPTVAALEDRLTHLAEAEGCVSFSSGMAAIDALFRTRLSAADHVVVSEVVYGGTPRLLDSFYEPYGVQASYVDPGRPGDVEEAIRPETELVFVESPANPTLRLADVSSIARITETHDVPLAVDNTFLTPLGQDAFALGADVSVHSTTKYIEGHNATIGGAVLTRDDATLLDDLRFLRKSAGTNQTPQQAWLTLQGVKTLPVRLATVSRTAQTLAERLADHPGVERVRYPGLPSFPQRKLAGDQHEHHGGILAFELADGFGHALRTAQELEVVELAENLGATETLVTHPASMTHASLDEAERARLGITPGLLRLSVGLEDPGDLWADLEGAIDRAGGGAGGA